MPGLKIIATGSHLPGDPVDNSALARVLDTNDEWIRQRTGIGQRYFAEPGQGASDLAVEASRRALDMAGLQPTDLDYILFNTMTPDHLFPGSGAVLGAKLGTTCPALDLKGQCAGFLFSLQTAQGLASTGAARRILLVGAEAHAGLMPWQDWDIVRSQRNGQADQRLRDYASQFRGWAIIFGDGAGAVILEATETEGGVRATDLHTDGRYASQLWVQAGFRDHPYLDQNTIARGEHMLTMDGKEVFKHAVTKLPRSVKAACDRAEVALAEVDWFVAHQANQRINDAIVQRLKLDPAKAPSNIERVGNTSGATIPILLDDMMRDGRLQEGQTLCFLALGSGLHWGASVFFN